MRTDEIPWPRSSSKSELSALRFPCSFLAFPRPLILDGVVDIGGNSIGSKEVCGLGTKPDELVEFARVEALG